MGCECKCEDTLQIMQPARCRNKSKVGGGEWFQHCITISEVPFTHAAHSHYMNMSMYTLILKNEKERTYKRVRFFLVMLNALVILMLIINSPEVFDRLWRPYFILALCALYFFFHS